MEFIEVNIGLKDFNSALLFVKTGGGEFLPTFHERGGAQNSSVIIRVKVGLL